MIEKVELELGSCIFCKKDHKLDVTEKQLEQINNWKRNGGHIQNVCTLLTTTQRESLLSNICKECQDRVFNSSYEEDVTYEAEEFGWGTYNTGKVTDPSDDEIKELLIEMEFPDDDDHVVEFKKGWKMAEDSHKEFKEALDKDGYVLPF